MLKRTSKPFYVVVSGNSMAPTINDGDRILVEPFIKNSLEIGKIIVFRKFIDHLTVHRIINIVGINEKRFYCETKGDNNAKSDPYRVFNHEIIGIVNIERTIIK